MLEIEGLLALCPVFETSANSWRWRCLGPAENFNLDGGGVGGVERRPHAEISEAVTFVGSEASNSELRLAEATSARSKESLEIQMAARKAPGARTDGGRRLGCRWRRALRHSRVGRPAVEFLKVRDGGVYRRHFWCWCAEHPRGRRLQSHRHHCDQSAIARGADLVEEVKVV